MRPRSVFRFAAVAAALVAFSFSGMAVKQIDTCQELQDMRENLSADYEVTGRIDCSVTES